MKLNTLNIFAALLLIAGANASSMDGNLLISPDAYYTCSVKAMDGDVVRGEAVYKLDSPLDLTGYIHGQQTYQVRRSGQLKCHPQAPSVETLIRNCQTKAQEEFPGANHVITGLYTKFINRNFTVKVIRDPDFIDLDNENAVKVILNQMNRTN